MFPGLGAQYTDMGLDLYQTYPLFREAMDHCFEILNSLGYDLKKRIFLSRSDRSYKSNIDEFDIAQLALFVFEYALAKLLVSWGIKPQAMIGYSFGEYAAACLSGVLTPTDALKLIVIRGKYIDKIPPGAMVSIPLQAEQLKTILSRFPQLSLAIDNGPSCIAAGPLSDVIVFEEAMKKEKRMCIRIQGVRALHAKMMDPILAEFTAAASKEITPGVPMIPYISNVTGGWITAADAADPAYWARHLNHTVKFSDGIQQLMKLENAVFLEIGPGRDLSNLLVRHIEGKPGFKTLDLVKGAGQDRPDNYVLLNRLGKLWLWGIPIDWRRFYAGTERYRVSLPGYPFERRAFPTAMDFDKNFARVFAQYFQDSQAGKPGASMEDIAVPDASDAGQEPSVRPLLETDYQSPRDEIEQSLARIWSKFFGFEPIGIDDNFFELGGDSLKAVIVLKRIQEELAVEVPLDRFLKGPIIRTLAKWIKDNSRDALRERAFSLFSPIRPSASAAADLQKYVEQPVILLNEAPQTQKKIFCFPSALAHGMVYKTLSSMIPGYSFYSFNFIQDEDRVDQYLDIITTLQPAGPYLLFEYSAGVKITFEVAEALEKRGFAVSDVILVDSFWPGDRMDPEVPEAVIKGLEKYHEELDAVFLQDQVIRRVRAYRRYFTLPTRPGVVNANIHLILSEENMGMPRARCWEPFTTKNAVIYQGHGPHDDMLRPGFVEKNAEIVRQILAKSDSN
jgi:malonyl CoA-acyl carrier protein transacylase/thioesterase domain-containing protein